jgi:hypothetical protein
MPGPNFSAAMPANSESDLYERLATADTVQLWNGGSPHSAHHRGRCKPTRCSLASQPTSAASSPRRYARTRQSQRKRTSSSDARSATV